MSNSNAESSLALMQIMYASTRGFSFRACKPTALNQPVLSAS